MAKVSVIVPVYNAEKYLKKCLRSVLNQTLEDVEVIAINDGSTDNSLKVLERFQDQYKNLKVIDSVNSGAGGARNKGLDVATGEFIKFVDSDDYLRLDILERMFEIAQEHKVGLVRGNYKFTVGSLGVMNYKANFSGLKGNQVVDVRENKDFMVTELSGIGNKFIRRDVIGDLRFPERTRWEDLAVMPVTVANAKSVYYMDEPVYNYRLNRNTTFSEYAGPLTNILDIFKCVNLIEQHMQELGLSEEYMEQIKGLYILHSVMRTGNVMTWPNMPEEKKQIIINSIIRMIELKYPDWEENKYLEIYARYNPTFKDVQRLPKYLDDNMRRETSEEAIANNVSRVFENSARVKK